MENLYKKYQNYHEYLKEFFDDNEYDRKDFVYKNIYIPFIRNYLPNVIKNGIDNYKEDNLKDINNYILVEPISLEVEREITTYLIEDNAFVISMWNYNDALSMIKNFFNSYNLNPKEIHLKSLIDAYYMELQRIDYELNKEGSYTNYYKELNNQIVHNEIETIESEELYEDLFLKTFVPSLINSKLINITSETNWDFISVNFEILIGEKSAIEQNKIIIEEKYYDIIYNKIKMFIQDYQLNVNNIVDPDKKEIYICSLKKLVDAYYMEIQRLEYINQNEEVGKKL